MLSSFVSTKQVNDTDVMSLLVMALELPSANQLNQSCAEDQSGFKHHRSLV